MAANRLGLLLIVGLLLALPGGLALAQTTGLAEIASPAPGVPLQGIVAITGTADHPAFASFTVDFGYDPNPTDTWFPLRAPGDAPVIAGTLAEWNTDVITPGRYMLRLQVFASDGSPVTETIVTGILVQDDAAPVAVTAQPTPTSPVALPPTSTPRPAAPTPTVDSVPTVALPPASGSSGDAPADTAPDSPLAGLNPAAFGRAFGLGAAFSLLAFVFMGVYSLLWRRLRGPFRKWLRRTLTDLRRP